MLKNTNKKVLITGIALLMIIGVTALAQTEESAYSPIVFGPSLYFLGPNEVEPNNTFEQANGHLESGREYFGLPNDPDDYFSFENGALGEIEIRVDGLDVAEGQIIVYHEPEGSPPQIVTTTDTPPPNFEILLTRKDPGTYYVVVHVGPAGLRQDIPYTLRVTFQPAPTPTPGSEPTLRPTEGASPTPTESPTRADATVTPTNQPTVRPSPNAVSTPKPAATQKP